MMFNQSPSQLHRQQTGQSCQYNLRNKPLVYTNMKTTFPESMESDEEFVPFEHEEGPEEYIPLEQQGYERKDS